MPMKMAQWDKEKQYKTDKQGNFVSLHLSFYRSRPPYSLRSTNRLSLIGKNMKIGGLAQIGGTILDLCGLEVPNHYLPSLIHRTDNENY